MTKSNQIKSVVKFLKRRCKLWKSLKCLHRKRVNRNHIVQVGVSLWWRHTCTTTIRSEVSSVSCNTLYKIERNLIRRGTGRFVASKRGWTEWIVDDLRQCFVIVTIVGPPVFSTVLTSIHHRPILWVLLLLLWVRKSFFHVILCRSKMKILSWFHSLATSREKKQLK